MIADLTSYTTLEDFLRREEGKHRIAFLPVGCTEQHGPFLPLGTDTIVAQGLAQDLCLHRRQLGSPGVVYPALAYSPSRSNARFPGSTSVGEGAFRSYLSGICRSLLTHRFEAVAVLCLHGPAEPSLVETAFVLNQEQCEAGARLRPLLVLGVSRCREVFRRHLGDQAGKHADYKELVLLYKVLGKRFFSEDLLCALKEFDEQYCRHPPPQVGVYGVPMERRSVDGVIGRPFPGAADDLPQLADALWTDLVRTFSTDIDHMLDSVETR
jgi:creatinine amidohydrolase/Fe(II)-dependent formamide hydrolase-like protein